MVLKKVSLLEFENNVNIGLYLFVNDKFCLIGQEVSESKKKEIEKILNVPVYLISILNTQLVGVFIAGNNEILIIPEILGSEKEKLEVIAKKHDVKLIVIDDKTNTFGNNISVGDKELLISKDYDMKFSNYIKKQTGLKNIFVGTDEYKATGGLCRFIDGRYFVSQELDEKDFSKIIKKVAGVGTCNSGSNFISSGLVGNKFGLLIGSLSTTIEIQTIVEAFEDE